MSVTDVDPTSRSTTGAGRDDLWPELVAALPSARLAAARVLGPGPDVDDCVGAALELALAAPSIQKPAAWLVEVSRRRAVDLVRRRQAESRACARWAVVAQGAQADIADDIADHDAARWLAGEASALPVMTREVLARVCDGATAANIAADLGLTRRAVESHTLRARQHLRSAWTRAMAGLIGVAATLRRTMGHTTEAATATAAAFSATVLLLGGGTGVAGPTHAVSFSSPVRPGASTGFVRASHGAALGTTTRLGARADSHAGVADGRSRQPVVAVRTPVAKETVSTQHRPGPDGPIGSTVYCVRHFVVTARHIGC